MSATTPTRRILLTALAPVGIFAAAHLLIPYKLLKPSQFPVAMIRRNADLVADRTRLLPHPYLVPAVAWVCNRGD